jgi:hypothetical protein
MSCFSVVQPVASELHNKARGRENYILIIIVTTLAVFPESSSRNFMIWLFQSENMHKLSENTLCTALTHPTDLES